MQLNQLNTLDPHMGVAFAHLPHICVASNTPDLIYVWHLPIFLIHEVYRRFPGDLSRAEVPLINNGQGGPSNTVDALSPPGAISSDLYRHHFWEDILNFPFLFSFPMNLYCI